MGRCDKPCVCLAVHCGYSKRHSVTSSQGQCGAALAFKGKALLGGDDIHVCSRGSTACQEVACGVRDAAPWFTKDSLYDMAWGLWPTVGCGIASLFVSSWSLSGIRDVGISHV
jgi:hypothetical protein